MLMLVLLSLSVSLLVLQYTLPLFEMWLELQLLLLLLLLSLAIMLLFILLKLLLILLLPYLLEKLRLLLLLLLLLFVSDTISACCTNTFVSHRLPVGHRSSPAWAYHLVRDLGELTNILLILVMQLIEIFRWWLLNRRPCLCDCVKRLSTSRIQLDYSVNSDISINIEHSITARQKFL